MLLRRLCRIALPIGLLVLTSCASSVRQADPTQPPGTGPRPDPSPVVAPPSTTTLPVLRAVKEVADVLAKLYPTTTTSTAVPVVHVVPPSQKPRVVGSGPVTDPQATGTVNGFPCGGLLPSCCTLRMESGGDPTIVEGHGDPFSHASGLWQFIPSTWNNYQGYPYAAAAPPDIQNQKAIEVFAGGAGASNWYGDGCYGGR